MRILYLLSAAAFASAISGVSQAEAQYVDFYELSAYCSAGYYEACAMLDAYAMQTQAPAYGGYNTYDPYAAHAQRMDDIYSWGNQMMANGAANSAILDQRHDAFMETLRN
jgi:hypothetical protein